MTINLKLTEKGCPFRTSILPVRTLQGDGFVDVTGPCQKEKCIFFINNQCIFISIYYQLQSQIQEGDKNETTK